MEKKPWYMSLTLRGLALTTLAIFAPKYAAIIPPLVGDLSAIAGLVITAIGRVRKQDLTLTVPKLD